MENKKKTVGWKSFTIPICDGRAQKIRMQDRGMAGFVVSLDSFTGCPLLKQKEQLGKNAPKKLYLTYRDELGAHRAILLW